MSGEPGHLSDGGDHWVGEKHPYAIGVDNRCTECGQPESNAGHPPLPEEAPAFPTLDEQMSAAVGSMRQLSREVVQVDRKGWTREDWVREAEEIMDDIDGSVLALLNGHIMAVLEELHDLRRRNESGKALRTFDMQTILQVSPVVDAAQRWLAANEALWNEADQGKGVAGIPESPNFKPSVKAIKDLEEAVRAYNAIVNAEDEDEGTEPVHSFEPGTRVFHDVRQRWYVVIECDMSVGQSLVDEDGHQVWLNNHHLWLTDEDDEDG